MTVLAKKNEVGTAFRGEFEFDHMALYAMGSSEDSYHTDIPYRSPRLALKVEIELTLHFFIFHDFSCFMQKRLLRLIGADQRIE